MTKKILIIDDNRETLVIENAILTQAGYQVYTAPGGKEALQLISELKEINLILLDYEMDGMNGPGFLEAFEQQFPILFKQIPVIYVTAHDKPPQKLTKRWIPKMKDLDTFVGDVGKALNLIL